MSDQQFAPSWRFRLTDFGRTLAGAFVGQHGPGSKRVAGRVDIAVMLGTTGPAAPLPYRQVAQSGRAGEGTARTARSGGILTRYFVVLAACLTAFGSQHPPKLPVSSVQHGFSKPAALRGKGEFPDGYSGARTIDDLNALFLAPARIQREASEAAGRWIPMVQENVKGTQPWVGPAAWHYGSFYLWGDVPALMPMPVKAQKFNPDGSAHGVGSWFAVADSKNRGASATKNTGGSWFVDGSSGVQRNDPRDAHLDRATKNTGGSWFNIANNTTSGKANNPARGHAIGEGRKNGGDWFGKGADMSLQRRASSGSNARKAASARIAKIPFPLAQHIAHSFRPNAEAVA